jgi:hypothetical protein
MKRVAAAAILATMLLVGHSGDGATEQPVGMANPASVFCEEQGGKLDIRKDADGNETGFCVFADGAEVREWAFYHGEAGPELPRE